MGDGRAGARATAEVTMEVAARETPAAPPLWSAVQREGVRVPGR